jgi:hypothetical protein
MKMTLYLRSVLRVVAIGALLSASANSYVKQANTVKQADSKSEISSCRSWGGVNPDSWFSLLIPQCQRCFVRAADTFARTYSWKGFKVYYIYWATRPNFLRDLKPDEEPTECAPTSMAYKESRRQIGRRSARVRECVESSEEEGQANVVEVYYPQARVYDSGVALKGEFILTVWYRKAADRAAAWWVAKSLQFLR